MRDKPRPVNAVRSGRLVQRTVHIHPESAVWLVAAAGVHGVTQGEVLDRLCAWASAFGLPPAPLSEAAVRAERYQAGWRARRGIVYPASPVLRP